jgi:tetratricopeptide (TPR) repeat protein
VERGSARHRLTAGASTLLAVVAGVLINVVTSGWSWPLAAGLAVFVCGWTGFEVWRAGQPHGDSPTGDPVSAAPPLRSSGSPHPRPGRGVGPLVATAPDEGLAQLPRDTTTFTGRTDEVDRLVRLAGEARDRDSDGSAVIFAIDGMAGVGKTALAVHAARRVIDRFPDGCLFLDLHGYTGSVPPVEPRRALHRLLRAVGVPGDQIPAEVDDQSALWRSRMAGRRMLIVLDNARTAEQVRPLLPAEPGCLIIVTSRRRLVALDDARSLSLDVLSPADAAALFTRIAGADRIGGQPEEVDRVVSICGWLPLAVRIAAGRLRGRPSWRVRDLADQLIDHRAAVDRLDDGERSVLAALAVSVDDLPTDRRRMFRRLGLHPGPDIDAGAAAALDGVDLGRAETLLEDLLDDHLLIQAVPRRYRFHDLVRAYAAGLQRAEEPDRENRECLDRLFEHYLGTADGATAVLHPARRGSPPPGTAFPTPQKALAWLNAERGNLSAVSAHAAKSGRPDIAIGLSAVLFPYLDHGGHWDDALKVHDLARDLARRGGDRAAEVDALMRIGETIHRMGPEGAATQYFRTALDHYLETNELAKQARALVCLGMAHWHSGPFNIAADFLRRALAIQRRLGDTAAEADALDSLGMVLERQGRDDEAAVVFRDALPLFQEHNDRTGEAGVLDSLGCIASRQGQPEAAIDLHRQAIDIYRTTGSRIGLAHAFNDLGLAYRRCADYEQAIACHEQALATFATVGYRRAEGEARNGLGEALVTAGDLTRAEREHATALSLAEETGDRFEQARAHNGLAAVSAAEHNTDAADRHRSTAQAIERSLGIPTVENTKQ